MTTPRPFYHDYLTKEEFYLIQCYRAERMTGYPSHQTKDGLYYSWPYGRQPDPDVLAHLTHSEPVYAAQKFLNTYEKRAEGHTSKYAPPVVKKRRCPECNQEIKP